MNNGDIIERVKKLTLSRIKLMKQAIKQCEHYAVFLKQTLYMK